MRVTGRETRPSHGSTGHTRTHTNGHEVRKDDQVPQVVKVEVAEEELGTLQKRGLVLGPRWVLLRERTLRNVGPPAAVAMASPTTPVPPDSRIDSSLPSLLYPSLPSLRKSSQTQK